MILANMLNHERTILSPNWFYSTELRVFNLQWFYRIGLFIFPNDWTHARTLAMALFMLVVIAAWLFCMNACKAGDFGLWAAAFAIWPFGFRYHFLATYGGYYFVFHIFSLTILGVMLLLSFRDYSKGRKLFLILMGSALSFASGLNGVRQMIAFCAPVCLAAVVALIIDVRKESITQWKQLWTQKRKKINYLMYSIVFAFINAAGFMVNSRILSQKYTFQSQNGISWQVNSDTEIPDAFIDLIQLFGFRDGVKVLSFNGIASALGFAVGIFIIYSIIRLCKNYSRLSQCEQIVFVSAVMSIIVTGISLCYMDHRYSDKYWLPIIPFIIMLIYLELKTDTFGLKGVRSALLVLIAVSISICGFSTVKLAIDEPLYGKKGLYEVAMWLEENDYQRGMAEFWKSQCITEMTDGKIEMWNLRKEDGHRFTSWLQDKSHINPPEGRVFILLDGTADETRENANVVKGNGVLVYGDDRYSVYEFEDASWMGE